jgi:hypothetical protein
MQTNCRLNELARRSCSLRGCKVSRAKSVTCTSPLQSPRFLPRVMQHASFIPVELFRAYVVILSQLLRSRWSRRRVAHQARPTAPFMHTMFYCCSKNRPQFLRSFLAFHSNVNTPPVISHARCTGSANCSSMVSASQLHGRCSRCTISRSMSLAPSAFLQIINRCRIFDLLRRCLAVVLCTTRITSKNGFSAGFHIAPNCCILYYSYPLFPAEISVRAKLLQSWATLPSNSGKDVFALFFFSGPRVQPVGAIAVHSFSMTQYCDRVIATDQAFMADERGR